MIDKIVNMARKNDIARRIYRIIMGVNFSYSNPMPQIKPIGIRKSEFDFNRVNLLIPSINNKHLFGGASTALMIFDEIIKKADKNTKVRLILTDAVPNKEALEKFSSFELVSQEDDTDIKYQMLSLSEKKGMNVYVTKNDKFIATAWWTACAAQNIIRKQASLCSQGVHKMIYIIQDFEPSFYNWSANYVMADSTYKSDIPTIAVFNSSLLKDFFKEQKYSFFKEFYFEPRINELLKKNIGKEKDIRKKNILFYGRPSVDRNCFPLIIKALKKWVWMQPKCSEWQLISIGEQHASIDLGNGNALKSLGKLSLPAYADLLSESAIGLSFMVSPHPSYPPLEMAHFGLLTITNSYANKDLSKFHDNIASLKLLTPDTVVSALIKMTKKFSENPNAGSDGKSHIPYYCQDSQQFPFLDELVDVFMN